MNAQGLRDAVEALAGTRAAKLDPVGLDVVRRLLERVDRVPDVARERLLSRAEAHLAAFRARADGRHSEAVRCIEELESAGHEGSPLRTLLASGDHLAVRRAHARLRARRTPVRRSADEAFRSRLRALAADLGVSLDESSASPVALAGRLYRKAAADASAERALERAGSTLPSDAGRYHAATVAAHTLRAMRESSLPYLRAQVARLDALAAVHQFVMQGELLAEHAALEAKKAAAAAKKAAAKAAPKKKAAAKKASPTPSAQVTLDEAAAAAGEPASAPASPEASPSGPETASPAAKPARPSRGRGRKKGEPSGST
ncbi:MAG: DUF2894 domain-containing protein [Polyangiales bacterium]